MKRKRRNELLEKILLWIEESSLTTAELLNRIDSPGGKYPSKETYKKFREKNLQERREIERSLERVKERQNFYSTLSKLRKDGLIKNNNDGTKNVWNLAKKGVEKIFKLKSEKLPTNNNYKIIPVKSLIIVTFDIPEKESKKRVWLRDALKNLDYKMLCESVWIGTNELPEEFIDHLQEIKILKLVKIFSVYKQGNIKELN